MVQPQRTLIRPGGDFGRCGKGARPECAKRIIRQRITGQQRRDLAADWNGQRIHTNRILGKSHDVDTLPLRLSWHGEHLRCPQNVPEPLIFREIKCLSAAIVNMRYEDRAAVGHPEFIARKRRKTPLVQVALVVKEISRIERRIAHKLEQAAVYLIPAGLGRYVRESRRAMSRVRGHHAGIVLHFLDGVHIEVRERGPAEFRVGGVRSIHAKDGGRAALAVDRKLLREIRRTIGVRHRSGGKEQEFAEVPFIQRQAGHFTGGTMLDTAAVSQSGILDDYDTKLLPLLRELKIGCAPAIVLDAHAILCRPDFARRTYRKPIVTRPYHGKGELAACGSCSGILSLAVRRDQLHGGHPDRISCRVVQNAPPGIRRRTVEKRNVYEYQDEYEGTSECAGQWKHRASLYAC